jgi:hypothetical protein
MHRRSLSLGAATAVAAPPARLGATDPMEPTRLQREYRLRSFETVPFVALGDYRQSTAWRDHVTGILKGPSVVFWNVSKS